MESNNSQRKSNNIFQKQRRTMRLISSLRNRNNIISEQENRNDGSKQATEMKGTFLKLNSEQWVAVATVALAVFTAVLAWYTYQLFSEASNESKTAQQSHLSDSLAANRRFIGDSILTFKRFQSDTAAIGEQSRNSEKLYELNKAANENSQAISKATLKQQINALNEAKTEFEKENRPYMEIADILVDTTFPNNTLRVDFRYGNVGKFPAKILLVKVKVGIGPDTSFIATDKWHIATNNNYQPTYSTSSVSGVLSPCPKVTQTQIKEGRMSAFLFVNIEYQTVGLSKVFNTEFEDQITYTPSGINHYYWKNIND